MFNFVSRMKERINLVAIIKELPIITFFLYIAYLCVLFHHRDHRMLDYTVTFDHWWYFHYRLMEGSLAQWNPFSLLGRIAVQWNFIPLSILFSPFLVFSELDLETFHFLFIIGTFLSISVIYFVGRVLQYDRFISLVPVVAIITGGYRYWASRLLYTNFLFFYPLAIVCLLYALKEKGRKALIGWWTFGIMLSLSFTSARLENIVYSYVFILLIFLVLGIYQFGNWKKMGKFFLLGIIVTAITFTLTAWQLSFLITSTLENCRLSTGVQFQKFFDVLLLKWTLVSILYQPVLILMGFNICLLSVIRYCKPAFLFKKYHHSLKLVSVLFISAVQFLFLKLLLFISAIIGLDQVRAFVPPNTHPAYSNLDIVFSWSGLVSILLLICFYVLIKKNITIVNLFSFFTAMFAGFYIAEYSWHIWPINTNTHFFFMIPLFASFIPFGAVRLMLRKRTWILSVLVIYHFIGETGFFYLFEIFGIPWLAPRAALAEIPFQIVLMLEGMLFFIEGVSVVVITLLKKLRSSFVYRREQHILNFTNVGVKAGCVLFVFLTVKMFLMPVGVINALGSSTPEKVYLREFPFEATPVNKYPAKLNQVAYEAKRNSELIREAKKHVNPLKRAGIESTLVSLSDNMFYKFMPAYSQTLNTAPVYATELPKTMRTIFIPDFEEKQGTLLRKPHPEMNPTFIDYKREEGKRIGISDIFGNQSTPVMLFPHAKNDVLYREIIAEEGSNTPRAFLTQKLVQFNNYVDEYDYLNSALARRNLLTDQITTSDSRFIKKQKYDHQSPLNYTLNFRTDEPEHIVIDVSSDKNAYLALMDTWSKGWRAFIDGRETEIYRGYIGTRFIRVESGEHIVEFKYTVPGLIMSSIVSVVAWIMMLLAMIIVVKITKNNNISVSA